MIYTCYYTLSKPTECTKPRVNPKVNCGLWVIMICQLRFIDCNKCTTLVEEIDNVRLCMCEGAQGIWEISAFLSILL